VLVTLGLLAVMWPVMVMIAAAIRLESRGPVLFRQQRVGAFGRPFTMLKFRSMVSGAAAEPHQAHVARLIRDNLRPDQLAGAGGSLKLAGDARITRVGALIRQTSLDELPQLFNVLAGQMSLVGPRPPLPYEVDLYQEWHLGRLAAQPGVTGLWQVRGRNQVSFDEMVRMDLDYIQSQSLWLDARLLLETPWAALVGRGAG
jgi:lipopolysaccharide/colanic/teichoic acid biosynthesis glycosyltransferase